MKEQIKTLKIKNSTLTLIYYSLSTIWLVIMPIKQSGDRDRADFWGRRSCNGAVLKKVAMSKHWVLVMELRVEPAKNSGDVYGSDFEGCYIDMEPIKKPYVGVRV